MAKADEQSSAGRKRKQYAEKAEQLAECEQGENHRDRMQADTLPDQEWGHEGTFKYLADTKGDGNRQQSAETLELHQGGDQGQRYSHCNAEVRDENQQSGY